MSGEQRNRISGYRGIIQVLRCLVPALCYLAAGCELVTEEGPPSNKQIYALYNQTVLKQSTSAEVLSRFGPPKYALLSQSKSIVAIAGTTKAGHKIWFNMVSFDESELVAKRKYYFFYNERPKQLFVEPWEGMDFGCQMVLPKEILDQTYADEDARRIAVLKEVDADTRKDTSEIGSDNMILSQGGMMAGRAMDSLLTELDASPALAARLSEPNWLEFEHINLNKGRLRMVIDNDIVTVKVRLGSYEKQGGKAGSDGLDAMNE